MTTFTGSIHRDNWKAFFDIALPMLLDPGLRDEDFKRLKDAQANALKEDLRSNNEEELGKERLQANIFAGTPYGHPQAGTVEGLKAISVDGGRIEYALRDLRSVFTQPGAMRSSVRGSSPPVRARA